ncbi:hypothetical protein GCM10017044_13790 [Kordiimonas sediminis]|uniref:Beta-lactamase-related domain-containing protein n=1 Tax=Kordiimonas sediminis TaxID=1735581 RepID=A0A919E6Y7_9PROT|nr:serine hydrolase domain-containing protein [Kordiimonas sediminis]GHF20229.1 hypothetical protein GCM10017044_13790 [Kordiimonas sediminis]
MRSVLLGILLVAGLLPAYGDTALEEALRPQFEAAVAQDNVVGITFAIGAGDTLLWAEGFGDADYKSGAPVTVDTKMRPGSVSKIMTAALLARLYERGLVDLDTDVSRLVPEYGPKQWPISLRQLTTHTAGVRHYRGNEFASNVHYPTVIDGLVIFSADPLEFEPGTKVSYTSYGWNLISAALEKMGGDEFLAMMDREVFKPLNLDNTLAEDVTKDIPNLARFHVATGYAPDVDNSYKWAGGGFTTTATDMMYFGLAHVKPGYLKAETLDLLFKEQQLNDGTPTGFGIGWMVGQRMQDRLKSGDDQKLSNAACDYMVWHSGGSMGAVALLLVDPEADISVALMANHQDSYPTLQRIGLAALRKQQEIRGKTCPAS